MKRIFESRSFRQFRNNVRLDEAVSNNMRHSQRPTVFLSHKHSDLEDVKDIIGFLQTNYNVSVYIDSNDSSLPSITSGRTAAKLKKRIEMCDKFIFLATNEAIESKWCNWELGFGDAHKFKNDIALFPVKPRGSANSAYRGSEYMEIYPYISFYAGTEKYSDGTRILKGYYVCTKTRTGRSIPPLSIWLNN